MERKLCAICGTEMIVKPLFTSVYHECPRCDGKKKPVPDYTDEGYIIPNPYSDPYPDWNSKVPDFSQFGIPTDIINRIHAAIAKARKN